VEQKGKQIIGSNGRSILAKEESTPAEKQTANKTGSSPKHKHNRKEYKRLDKSLVGRLLEK
jgi:hypothetical protein